MQFTAEQLTALLGGKLEGDGQTTVHQLSKIEEGERGSLCFLANKKYESFLYTTNASVVIIPMDLELKELINSVIIRVENPRDSFTLLLEQYDKMLNQSRNSVSGIEKMAVVSENAVLGEGVYIGNFVEVKNKAQIGDNCKIKAHSYIGDNVKIGKNTIIHSGVHIYHNCEIGDNCIIHSGTVIGSDGFGFVPQKDGSYKKMPQVGNVMVGNNVEIGANCAIDRATMGSTVIGNGVKLDNLIQIAHNVVIGENTVIAAQAGISGSTSLGKNVVVGGQAGLVGHISIADGSKINAQSGVTKNIKEEGKSWSGTPFREFREHYKSIAYINKVPKLQMKIKELEKELKELKT